MTLNFPNKKKERKELMSGEYEKKTSGSREIDRTSTEKEALSDRYLKERAPITAG